jgi:hypothetical protein
MSLSKPTIHTHMTPVRVVCNLYSAVWDSNSWGLEGSWLMLSGWCCVLNILNPAHLLKLPDPFGVWVLIISFSISSQFISFHFKSECVHSYRIRESTCPLALDSAQDAMQTKRTNPFMRGAAVWELFWICFASELYKKIKGTWVPVKGGEVEFKWIKKVCLVLAPHSLRTLRRATLRASTALSARTPSVSHASGCSGRETASTSVSVLSQHEILHCLGHPRIPLKGGKPKKS